MALLSDAVNCRLISDVPVGSYLSGGLDSTIIAGLAKKPHTWTVGFKNCNEFKWAKIASNEFASQHTEVLITEDEFISLLKKMIQKRREPFSVPNEILLYKMTKAVKKKNTVVLSGEGADELFLVMIEYSAGRTQASGISRNFHNSIHMAQTVTWK